MNLDDRIVIRLLYKGCIAFLNKIVTNKVSSNSSTYTALLSPQGRFLFEFFIIPYSRLLATPIHEGQMAAIDAYRSGVSYIHEHSSTEIADQMPSGIECVLLDCHKDSIPHIIDTIKYYIFDDSIKIDIMHDWKVNTGECECSIIRYEDTRHHKLPERAICYKAHQEDQSAYRKLRYSLGIPETSELEYDKTIILEANFLEIGAISTNKGCYIGQELISRTIHGGEIRKRFCPIHLQCNPQNGIITTADDNIAGFLKGFVDNYGIALLRNEYFSQNLYIDKSIIKPISWGVNNN